MSTSGRFNNPASGKSEGLLEAARLADEAFELLVRVDSSWRKYTGNEPMRRRLLERAFEALETFIDLIGPLEVEVSARGFSYRGTPVCSGDGGEHMTFRIHKGGIRHLGFYPGVSERELRDFIKMVDETRDGAHTGTLSADMMGEGFKGIDCLPADKELLEPQLDTVGLIKRARPPSDLETRAAAADKMLGMLEKSGVKMPVFSKEFFQINPNDVAERIQFEEGYKPFGDFIRLVLSILSQETQDQLLSDFAGLATSLYATLIRSVQLGEALTFYSETLAARGNQNLTDTQKRVLSELHRSLQTKEIIEIIASVVKGGTAEDEDQVLQILRTIPPSRLEDLLDVVDENHLDIYADAIGAIARGDVTPLLGRIGSGSNIQTMVVLRTLSRLKAQSARSHVRDFFLRCPAGSMFIEAFNCLLTLDTDPSETLTHLCKMALSQANDPKFRLEALQSIKEGHTAAEGPIRTYSTSAEFLSDTFDAKREVLRAFCRVNPEVAPDFLESTFLKVGMLSRTNKDKDDARRCAAFALGEIRSEAANAVLERGTKSRNAAVKESCRIALTQSKEEK